MAEERAIIVETAAGDALSFTRLEGFDEIGRCFEFTVSLVGEALDVEPADIVGRPVAIEAEGSEPKRWFHGLASEFRLVRVEERRAAYEVVLRPWLWLLSLRHDCRIFQNLSVVEIVEQVFGAYPEARFEKRLQQSYPPRDYCVQYDESDLDFVQRLLEHEGIFYFFEYAGDGHTLILADANAELKPAPGYATIPYHIEDRPGRRDRDFLSGWVMAASLRPNAYAHADYNFETPGLSLLTVSQAEPAPALFRGEHYRQPGAHRDVGGGDKVAAIRREELQAPHVRIRARGTVRGPAAGSIFRLSGHPRDGQNAEHLVVRADYRLIDPAHWPEHRSEADEAGETFRVELLVAPTTVPYRPPRRTPRPVMRGPQTARVVGPAGEEIFTDRYGRVKLHFFWNREDGDGDENSSCFVPVSQTWAGAGWGFLQVPRIGQEVIVDFIEGNPDRPIITGRVYNAAEMPAYALPGCATHSGWRSNTTPGGGGFNELMFKDDAGAELVSFQAQKDHALLVKNDRTKRVQHDQSDRIDNNAKHSVGVNLDEDVGENKTTKVGIDRKVEIGQHDTEKVGVNRSLEVGAEETIKIGASSNETIGMNHTQFVTLVQTVTIGAARFDTVGAAETRTVVGAQMNTIGAIRDVNVKLAQSHTIGASDSWDVGASQGIKIKDDQGVRIGGMQKTEITKVRIAKVGEDDSTEITGQQQVKIGKDQLLQVGKNSNYIVGENLTIEAKKNITIKCGKAEILMKDDGTVTIKGKNVSIDDKGDTSVKASGKIAMKGPSGITQN